MKYPSLQKILGLRENLPFPNFSTGMGYSNPNLVEILSLGLS